MLIASVDRVPEGRVTAEWESSKMAARPPEGGAATARATHRAATALPRPRNMPIAGSLEAVFDADERRQAVAQATVVEAEEHVGVDEQATVRVELEPDGARELVLGALGE